MVFVVQLFIYGFHELTEANIIAPLGAWHDATEPFGPDGVYGQYLTYLLVVLPVGWLALSTFFGPRAASRPHAFAGCLREHRAASADGAAPADCRTGHAPIEWAHGRRRSDKAPHHRRTDLGTRSRVRRKVG